MGWNKTEFHIRNDDHAFVVITPSGMSTALLRHRTINLEELSIKLRNWNLFWFATLPNKQMPRSKKGINSSSSTNRFPLSTLRFKTSHILFELLNVFITISEHRTSLPCDGISFAISHSSWLANTWYTNYCHRTWSTEYLSYNWSFPFSENKLKKVSL